VLIEIVATEARVGAFLPMLDEVIDRWRAHGSQRGDGSQPGGRDGEWFRVSHFGSFVAEVRAWPDLARIRFDIAALRETS